MVAHVFACGIYLSTRVRAHASRGYRGVLWASNSFHELPRSMSPRARPHPHIAIPPGAAPPSAPSPRHVDDWNFMVTPPDDPLNLWSDEHRNSTFTPSSPDTSRRPPHIVFPQPENSRPASRASSVHEATSPRTYAFPEPQVYRSPIARTASLRPSASHQNLGHRSTKSDSTLSPRPSLIRGESRPPSFVSTASSPEVWQYLYSSSRQLATIPLSVRSLFQRCSRMSCPL